MNAKWAVRTSIDRFMLPSDCSLQDVAARFAEHRVNTVFGTTEQGRCSGSFSRGDLIRAIAAGGASANKVSWNDAFERLYVGDSPAAHMPVLEKQLGNVIPILNGDGACVRILERTNRLSLEIAGKSYEPNRNVCVVAEIGNNHNGDVGAARALVEAAAEAGASAVKFQARVLDELYADLSDDYLRNTDFGTAYTVRQLKRFNLPLDVLAGLMDYARELGLAAICTPFDNASMKWLLGYKPDAIKIASCDLSNTELHAFLRDVEVPVLLSTGMNALVDIEKVAKWFRRQFIDATLLHANSTYPTPAEDVNLKFLDVLREQSPSGLVGYSGHERGIHIPLIAASMGAVVVEKHLTLDRSMEGTDHKVSLLPGELAMLCSQLADLAAASRYRGGSVRDVSQGEALNSIALEKGVYLKEDLEAGRKVDPAHIIVRSPRLGVTPLQLSDLSDRTLLVAKKAGDPLLESDFTPTAALAPGSRATLGAFGLPVRMRDCRVIWESFSPTFLEYHIFSTDLELEPAKHAQNLRGLRFRFHAPEQFEDGFVLDLVSPDAGVRERSERELLRCVKWCVEVSELSGMGEPPSLVVNVGGATYERAQVAGFDKRAALAHVAAVCAKIREMGVQVLPQSMPPFPWHFGGQGFHRLFVDVDDMRLAQEFGEIQFCLDLSHTFLACDYLGRDFYKAVEKVVDHVAYCHVSDSIPPNGEGLQIGEGVMDFRRMNRLLGLSAGKRPWIPEIWNGHLNNFSGFRTAIEILGKEFASAA